MALIITLVVAVIVAFLVLRVLKVPKCGNMILVTGGVKTGKTTLSVRLVYKLWKKQCLKVRIQNIIIRIMRRISKKWKDRPLKDKPLIYSNIPLAKVPYVPMTQGLLERQERFVYGSVIYMCESSLVADSMSFKDEFVNEQLLLFNKLIAHETRGGYLVYDTQSISDNHFAVKRCLSSYFYIHHATKIPFFVLMYVRELKFSEDNSAVNTFGEDVEDSLQLVIVPKSTWKMFDCYCYSALTDHLPVVSKYRKNPKSLKAHNIISFKKFKNLKGGTKNDK